MNRIFQIASAALAIGCAILAFNVSGTKKQLAVENEEVKQKFDAAQASLKKATMELGEAKQAKEAAEGKLATANTELDSAKSALATAQAKATELESSVAEATAKLAAVEAEKAKMTDAIGTTTPEEIKAKDTELAALREERRLLEDRLANTQGTVSKLQAEADSRKKGINPPGISGKIVAINTQWNFVVLDIGNDEKVVEGGEMTVLRANKPIAKVKIASVEANTSVADVVRAKQGGKPGVGDIVISN